MAETNLRPPGYYRATDKTAEIKEQNAKKKAAILKELEKAFIEKLAAQAEIAKIKSSESRNIAEAQAKNDSARRTAENENLISRGVGSGTKARAKNYFELRQAQNAEEFSREQEGIGAKTQNEAEAIKKSYIKAIEIASSKNEAELSDKLLKEAIRIDRSFSPFPKNRGRGGSKPKTIKNTLPIGSATAAAGLMLSGLPLRPKGKK